MKLIPYLTFNGNCEEALNFYKQALGGEITQMSKAGETPGMDIPDNMKDKIMHAALKFPDGELMMSDNFDNPAFTKGNNITLSLHPKTIAQEEEVFAKLSEGGQVTQPMVDTFWGARFGMVTDKFGIKWMFNTEIQK